MFIFSEISWKTLLGFNIIKLEFNLCERTDLRNPNFSKVYRVSGFIFSKPSLHAFVINKLTR